jgi:hypothetical protein
MVAQDTQGSSSTSHGSPSNNHGEMMDWLKEKSHDELSELLLRADEVIKQRESGTLRLLSLRRMSEPSHRSESDIVSLQDAL